MSNTMFIRLAAVCLFVYSIVGHVACECGPNESLVECVPCPITCKNKDLPPVPCNQVCTKGCTCNSGYVRNDNNACIPAEECKCAKNEVYQKCGTACPKTCINMHKPIICTKQCVPGCFCAPGYVRNKKKQCVLPQFCDHCPKREMYQICGTACPKTCQNMDETITCTKECVPGCFCVPGYVRNKKKQCVYPKQCFNCGKNEVYQKCGTACPTTCENRDNPTTCSEKCVQGCFCASGYVRNKKKQCVRPEHCENCGKNEVYQKCGTACPKTCVNMHKPISCTKECVPGCFCAPGYVRNKKKQCVLPQFCDHCPKREIYQICGTACPKTCQNMDETITCTKECVPGCFCAPGYVRNKKKQCVYPKQCFNCKKNEVYQNCGTACPTTCANKDNPSLPCSEKCVQGCFCAPGFVRDKNNQCILPEYCENCGKNEVYKKCGTACPKTCLNRFKPITCTKECVRGCFCAPGYVRNKYNDCILPEYCDNCGSNEVYQTCGTACPKTCENRNKKIKCTKQCVQGCFCLPGYVRNKNKKCILPKFCNPCGKNEVFSTCGSPCPRTCSNRNRPIPCPLRCARGCFCRRGYVRNKKWQCVKPSQCPKYVVIWV